MNKYVIKVATGGYVNERDWEVVLSIHDATTYATKAMAEHKAQSWDLKEKLEVVKKDYCN
jgi:hypothetical protein